MTPIFWSYFNDIGATEQKTNWINFLLKILLSHNIRLKIFSFSHVHKCKNSHHESNINIITYNHALNL